MLVVSDASPLNVLVRMGQVGILQKLFGEIVMPPAVALELSHAHTPVMVRDWLASKPSWVSVQSPKGILPDIPQDPGEREAISLAKELKADLLLVDDRKARLAAVRHGIAVTGTIGVLEAAAVLGIIDLGAAMRQLPMDFSIAPRLIKEALERDELRRQRKRHASKNASQEGESGERG